MLKVGLIGAGMIGRVHADGYKTMRGAELVAVADIIPERADHMAQEFGAKPFYDIDSLLALPGIDMVDICVPSYVHELAVVSSARAGKHVLCEKPFTLSLESADRMLEAVKQHGVKSMIAQVVRFIPQYLTIKKMLDDGVLGAPLATTDYRLAAPPEWGSWFRDPALSGGAVFDLQIHDLDFMVFMFGWPQKVFAQGQKSAEGAWNQVRTILDYGSHHVSIEDSMMMPAVFPFSTGLRLLGSQGCVDYNSSSAAADQLEFNNSGITLFLPHQAPSRPTCAEYDPYQAEIQYFVDCVAEGKEPLHTGFGEARRVLEIVMAVILSLETGQIVELTH
jgi:UDP-N-acetylglucosamine 3-dehydrogenase